MTTNSSFTIRLQPRDPLIARDARPFDPTPGARANTLDWPWPQSVAGALRTHIGNALGFDWSAPDKLSKLHEIALQGPLLVARRGLEEDWRPYFPAPIDAIVSRVNPEAVPTQREIRVTRLAPDSLRDGEGTDLPYPMDLRPMRVTADVKPERKVAFWSLEDIQRWLASATDETSPQDWLEPAPRDTRTHVAVEATTGTARKGHLFSTSGLVFRDSATEPDRPEMAMLARISGAPGGWELQPAFIPLGGERRLTAIEPAPGELWPAAPDLPSADARRIRLMLVTPGLFERGWLPGWLDRGTLEGAPPSVPGLRLKLVSAAVGRRMAISGWRLRDGPHGQRATRYAAPPGAVYFFELLNGPLTGDQWRRLWLASIADLGSDRHNGYGLALPGIW